MQRSANGMARDGLGSALAGAIGGAAGSAAMVAFNHVLGATGIAPRDRARHPEHRADALPNDTDGTIPDEPATHEAAARAAGAVEGRTLNEQEREVGGSLVHLAFGAGAGALYGALADASPRITAGGGVPFGMGLFLLAGEVGVPAAGLSRRPTTYPLSRHLASLASHVVYGLTLECVRRALTRR
jgi:putative membrane protein